MEELKRLNLFAGCSDEALEWLLAPSHVVAMCILPDDGCSIWVIHVAR